MPTGNGGAAEMGTCEAVASVSARSVPPVAAPAGGAAAGLKRCLLSARSASRAALCDCPVVGLCHQCGAGCDSNSIMLRTSDVGRTSPKVR